MELRRATTDDWAASRDIRLRALSQDPNAFCSSLESESGFDEQRWRNRLGHGITVLAWEGSDPVGTVTGKPDPHEEGGREIVAMWVAPAHRGTGLADSLIASVVDWAATEGAHEVALWVAEDNSRARSLYERVGFAATGETDAMRPGVDQLRMRLSLR
ncbi:GNAT family N-acetyltransferase [Leifsonella bigeumensis]